VDRAAFSLVLIEFVDGVALRKGSVAEDLGCERSADDPDPTEALEFVEQVRLDRCVIGEVQHQSDAWPPQVAGPTFPPGPFNDELRIVRDEPRPTVASDEFGRGEPAFKRPREYSAVTRGCRFGVAPREFVSPIRLGTALSLRVRRGFVRDTPVLSWSAGVPECRSAGVPECPVAQKQPSTAYPSPLGSGRLAPSGIAGANGQLTKYRRGRR